MPSQKGLTDMQKMPDDWKKCQNCCMWAWSSWSCKNIPAFPQTQGLGHKVLGLIFMSEFW